MRVAVRGNRVIEVGDIRVTCLSDGDVVLPPDYFRNVDWGKHQELLSEDGSLVLPLGCFLLETRGSNILVDAGVGPVRFTREMPFRAGMLPEELGGAGVEPDRIDGVICTHLHMDHTGWLVQEGEPFFPKARVYCHEADWRVFAEGERTLPFGASEEDLRVLWEDGRVELVEGDGPIARGVSVFHTPGHTPGHVCVLVSSGVDRVILLGDVVACPAQLGEPEWGVVTDVDPALAARTREAMWKEMDSSDAVGVGGHFPDLQVGRMLVGEGRRYFG